MKLKNFIIWMFIIICAFLIITLVNNLIKEGNECTSNPFIYGANNLRDIKGNDIIPMCSCSSSGGGFYFNNEEIYMDNPYMGYNIPSNFSLDFNF